MGGGTEEPYPNLVKTEGPCMSVLSRPTVHQQGLSTQGGPGDSSLYSLRISRNELAPQSTVSKQEAVWKSAACSENPGLHGVFFLSEACAKDLGVGKTWVSPQLRDASVFKTGY